MPRAHLLSAYPVCPDPRAHTRKRKLPTAHWLIISGHPNGKVHYLKRDRMDQSYDARCGSWIFAKGTQLVVSTDRGQVTCQRCITLMT